MRGEPISSLRIGVDAGGTFTDFVAETPDGTLTFLKLPSTPEAPDRAVLNGVGELADDRVLGRIAHASTVATNAFLEGRAARVGFLTTAGLEDVLAIGRQNRRNLYRLDPEERRMLVERRLVRGVSARTGANGEAVAPLAAEELRAAAMELIAAGAEILVLGFLHSAQHPALEREAETVLSDLGVTVVASHRVTPEPREYERWATAVVDAGLKPIVSAYFGALAHGLPDESLRIMLSNGGLVTAGQAAEHPAATILSGPAAGVIGACLVAGQAGFQELVTFDMGGTSCDVALVPGEPLRTTEAELDGVPIRVPLVDMQTVGAGGGSIARVDHAGALAVGPQSAGADPGPACYGRGGGAATVTDAHLLLGHLDPDHFLGGRRRIHPALARAALTTLADEVGAGLIETAAATLTLAQSHLERAVRTVTLVRGYDPADFTFVAFGGAGGLHAAALATALGARRVLIPRAAGVLSALGCLAADTRLDLGKAVLEPAAEWGVRRLEVLFAEIEEEARLILDREGVPAEARAIGRALSMRYRGQSYEIEVPLSAQMEDGAPADLFHGMHAARYGHARPEAPVEIVAARVSAVGYTRSPSLPDHVAVRRGAPSRRRLTLAVGDEVEVAAWDWDDLPEAYASEDPAIVFGVHATALIPPGWSWRIDRKGNLIAEASR